MTTVARTAFDLAGDPDPGFRASPVGRELHGRQVARVYNDCLARRGLTFVAEAAVLAALGKRGRNGTRLVRQLLRQFGPDYVPTQSDSEWLFTELVRALDVPEPERQVPISDEQGWIGTVDFLYRLARHVIEIDSTWHDGPLDQAADAERDRRLAAAGYRVLRFRYADLVLRPEWVVAQILAALAGPQVQ